MKLNTGNDSQALYEAARPVSAPTLSERKIGDLEKLTLSQGPEPSQENGGEDSGAHAPPPNPLKRAAVRDPEFDRKAPMTFEADSSRDRSAQPNKRLFDPNTDNTASGPNIRRSGARPDQSLTSCRGHDSRTHLLRSHKEPFGDQGGESPSSHQRPIVRDNSHITEDPSVSHLDDEGVVDLEPRILLQPETRPITHDQLVVEVKGIYAGLVMVEAKCIDVDEKQAAAAQRVAARKSGQEGLKQASQDSDPSHESDLTREQWQALIALHKTLLHEHHDFFLASQHPSASPALSRLAAKYSMPARMWRHGIHAFLEVLRQRLPESLEHMLAFIYIAYSMMALLYETVPAFEDTWIECLGDLGRYRMAIEDSDQKNREVWTGVAQFWYGKAADKSPSVGRLYHHLAILARQYTLQQLSLYLRALTCTLPFESAKGSIMTLFKPILDGRVSESNKPSSVEIIFIKSHGLLFTNRSNEGYTHCVQELLNGLMDSYIGRVTAKFKELGVYAALSNIASLFEYGVLRSKDISRSVFRLAFEEVCAQKRGVGQKGADLEDSDSMTQPSQPKLTVEDLTQQELKLSLNTITHASIITFGTLNVALRRIGDKNVYPLVHTYLVFLRSLVLVEKAMKLVEREIPWSELVAFLNALDAPHAVSPKVRRASFPKPEEGVVGRPLPEDFVMRGQIWSDDCYPNTWFMDAKVDDEERTLELPSFAFPRVERLMWLGHQIVSVGYLRKQYVVIANIFQRNCNQWLMYNETTKIFSVTQYVEELPKRDIGGFTEPLSFFNDADSAMSGLDELENEHVHAPDSPDRYNSSPEPDRGAFRDMQVNSGVTKSRSHVRKSQTSVTPGVLPKRILTKENAKMSPRVDCISPSSKPMNPDSVAWLKGEYSNPKTSVAKHYPSEFASDPRKLEIINIMDAPESDDLSKA